METVRCLFVGAAYMPPAVSREMGGNGKRAGRIDAAPTTPQKMNRVMAANALGGMNPSPHMGIESRKTGADGGAICRESCATYGNGCATKEPFPMKNDLFFEIFPQKQVFQFMQSSNLG